MHKRSHLVSRAPMDLQGLLPVFLVTVILETPPLVDATDPLDIVPRIGIRTNHPVSRKASVIEVHPTR